MPVVRSSLRRNVALRRGLLVGLAWPLTASAQQLADAGVNATASGTLVVGLIGTPAAQTVALAQRPESVVQVVTGSFHTCIRRASGRVSCWGLNTSGQCGTPVYLDGETNRRRAIVLAPTEMESLGVVADLAAGNEHTCAILAGGRIACWGSNTNHQLGVDCDTSSGNVPQSVPATLPEVNDAVELVAGHSHTCARLRTGHVICWGAASGHQCGTPLDQTPPMFVGPTEVPGLFDVTALAAHGSGTCALRRGGSVVCFGVPFEGRNLQITLTNQNLLTGLQDRTDNADIAMASHSVCVLRTDSSMACYYSAANWGCQGYFCDDVRESWETRSHEFGVFHGARIFSGTGGPYVIRDSGEASTWDISNEQYRTLGGVTQAVRQNDWSARNLSLHNSPREIAVGLQHGCALDTSGQVSCWGNNSTGQLGTLDALDHETPESVRGLYPTEAERSSSEQVLRTHNASEMYRFCVENRGAERERVLRALFPAGRNLRRIARSARTNLDDLAEFIRFFPADPRVPVVATVLQQRREAEAVLRQRREAHEVALQQRRNERETRHNAARDGGTQRPSGHESDCRECRQRVSDRCCRRETGNAECSGNYRALGVCGHEADSMCGCR